MGEQLRICMFFTDTQTGARLHNLMPWNSVNCTWKQLSLLMGKHSTLRVRSPGRAFCRSYQSTKTMQKLTRAITSRESLELTLIMCIVCSVCSPSLTHLSSTAVRDPRSTCDQGFILATATFIPEKQQHRDERKTENCYCVLYSSK